MARNYSMKEAVAIIAEGKDFESIMDIGRRYPILMNMVTKVAAKAGDDFVELMNHLPDHVTANKVNTSMKNLIEEGETDEVEEDEPDAAEEKPAKKEKEAGDDYESMTGKELYELLGKAGKRKDCKEKMGGLKKDDILAYIKKYGLEDDDVEEVEEENDGNPYEGKSAMDLFKECKKRGIKAAPKKPAKFYADMLIKDDEKAAELEDDGDDWGEEEAVEEKPTKKEKKEKKSKKEEVEEDADEDDDWDI